MSRSSNGISPSGTSTGGTASGEGSVLVLRALGLGDFLTVIPALRALRRAHPRHELVLAAPSPLASLAVGWGLVERVLPTVGPEAVAWTGPPPVAVNLRGRGPQSHRALRALHPERLYAFACDAADIAGGPQWSADEHEVLRWCRMLEELGIPADPADLMLAPPARNPELPADVVVVHPGAGVAEKRWPSDRFAAVMEAMLAAGHRVVVTGNAQERPLAYELARRAGLGSTAVEQAVLAGRTTLDQLATVVAHARLVISGDTGVAHLATAFGTRSVVLFGAVPPSRWGPPPDASRHRALWRASGRQAEPDGVLAIAPREVTAAAHDVLQVA